MRTAIRLSLAVLVFASLAVACGDDGTSVFDLSVGDCFDDPSSLAEGEEQITPVETVPCSEPHDNEIYHEYSLTDAVFPGQQAITEQAFTRCLGEFEAFVGISFQESDLELFPITPTERSWDDGNRVVYCALYALDFSKLTGSMRGSAR